jgi:hypothetical protein
MRPRRASGTGRKAELVKRDGAKGMAPAKKTATAPAKKQPAKSESTTVDLSQRFTAALAKGFSIKHVNDELFPGTSFAWRARRGPVNAERDAELIKTLTTWLGDVESGKIAAPERIAAAAGGGPSKRALAQRIERATHILTTARTEKSPTSLRKVIGEALDVLGGDRG